MASWETINTTAAELTMQAVGVDITTEHSNVMGTTVIIIAVFFGVCILLVIFFVALSVCFPDITLCSKRNRSNIEEHTVFDDGKTRTIVLGPCLADCEDDTSHSEIYDVYSNSKSFGNGQYQLTQTASPSQVYSEAVLMELPEEAELFLMEGHEEDQIGFSVEQWSEQHQISKTLFLENGFDSLQSILRINSNDLVRLGVSERGKQLQILSAVETLKLATAYHE